jgi:hypothetical protein
MVLTVLVVIRVNGRTRRGVLGIAAATVVTASAGCSLFGKDPAPERSDALQPVLNEALALAAALDRAAVTVPDLAKRLTPLADDHRAHAAELSRVIGKPLPSGAASPSVPVAGDESALLQQLRSAEQTAQRNAAAACLQAPAARATLVGSIAACRATHAEALR